MSTSPEVDIVYADLQDAYTDLEVAVHSPKQVRRAFSRFVELTQRLTSAMRKEFKAYRGVEWNASEFPGWDEITDLFKDLRNEEQHERQIYLSVHETRFYKICDDDKPLLSLSGTWDLNDQLMDSPPDGMTFYRADSRTGQMSDIECPAIRVEYQFLIQGRSEGIRNRLRAIGSANVHDLSKQCLSVLARYYEFYAEKLRN